MKKASSCCWQPDARDAFAMTLQGAGDGVRTHDIQLGKLALYQLSYTRGVLISEPQVGIEPTTARLRIECSTPELLWRLL